MKSESVDVHKLGTFAFQPHGTHWHVVSLQELASSITMAYKILINSYALLNEKKSLNSAK